MSYNCTDYIVDTAVAGAYGAAIGASAAIAVATGGAATPTTIGLSAAATNHVNNSRVRMKKEGVDLSKW